MNRLIARMLLIMVLVAYNYKTIHYCIKLSYVTITSGNEVEGEGESPESKKSDGKEEKKEHSEYLTNVKGQAFPFIGQLPSQQGYKPKYLSSDHSRTDYSPPDLV